MNWQSCLIDGQRSLLTVRSILPILARINRWIRIFQCKLFPVISIILYCIDDLIACCNNIGDMADADARANAEMIATKFVVQLEAEYADYRESKYLQLAQLFDPRVARRTPNRDIVKSLLEESKIYRITPFTQHAPVPQDAIDYVSDEEVEDPLDAYIKFFRSNVVASIRIVVSPK